MPQIVTNIGKLDQVIVGRVDPRIYAFSTETIPNYLKVGDTYRPLEARLDEWRAFFPNLEKQFDDVAKVDGETFFRDYSVHYFLEYIKHKARLGRESLPQGVYFSNEFFKDVAVKDVQEAIDDIKKSHKEDDGRYQFYRFDESRIPIQHTYKRVETYEPRPNQQDTIDSFKTALKNKRTNLLMYAVMRFGKSFTSMCCATEMKAKVVVIVSAKADVREEWKKTIESHKRFDGYVFLDSRALQRSETPIKDELRKKKKVAIFLTLQDLQGGGIKARHKELFRHKIDLLIIDETHFGARGEKYGAVLQELNITKRGSTTSDPKEKDTCYLDDLFKSVKVFNSKVRIHLSGTPYRILMGDEFKPEDIITFCQFTDIVEAQKAWDAEHLVNDDTNEWDNPYYGFPQMVRFAFHPNASTRRKLEELKKSGITYAFSALFRPKSINKDDKNQGHKYFYHKQEILDLLEIIDGSKSEEGMLGFLDYDKIKEGQMCRHIVCVLPFRASCDALEKLINDNKDRFKNLNQYEIVNIAGVDNERLYPNTIAVKAKIKECEKADKKTITLTVNRMLTGSTVEEWDTMLYFKDTASPQEYDQAIFRLQNQYIKTYKDKEGKLIKFNMKPQTLLVDFDPDRMFYMQEQKAQIYNVNTSERGNVQLGERIRKELEISPIITINKNSIEKVEPTNILDAVREYSKDKSVVDEATSIPVDSSLLEIDEVRKEIEKQGILGSRQGLKVEASKGKGSDLNMPEGGGGEEGETTTSPQTTTNSSTQDTLENELRKKFATYYSRILFFAFLTKSKVTSLEDIIRQTQKNSDNRRIIDHLDLDISVLKLIIRHINPFTLRTLDYKIQNLNTLANDISLEPAERAERALNKFGRLSSSEIVTPQKVADEMVGILPHNEIKNPTKVLDIASKQGEFVYAFYKKYGKKKANNFYSIPTSKVAYEFTRKVYELLGLDVSHIESSYNSYDLIKKEKSMINKNNIMINGQEINFNVVISNPPYQEMDGGAGVSAIPIYNKFVDTFREIAPSYISMIMPAKWYTDGKGLESFRTSMLRDKRISMLVDFTDSRDCFENVDIAGGICYFLWDNKHKDKCEFISRHNGENKISMRDLSANENFIRNIDAIAIIDKVLNVTDHYYKEKVSTRKPFGLATNVVPLDEGDITLRYNKGTGPYKSSLITTGKDMISKWKIIISYLTVEHAGQTDKDGKKKILSSLDMLEPNEISTETYLVVDAFNTKEEAEHLSRYLQTRFVRFLIAQLASTQHLTKDKFAYVPLQDFTTNSDIDWTQSVADIDQQLYKKYGLTKEEQQFIETMIKPM